MRFDPSKRPTVASFGLWCLVVFALYVLRDALRGIEAVHGFVIAFVMVSGAAIGTCVFLARADETTKEAAPGVLVGVLLVVFGGAMGRSMGQYVLLYGAGALFLSARLGVALGRRASHARYLWPLVIVAVGVTVWSAWTPSGLPHRLLFDRPPKSLLTSTMLTLPIPGMVYESVLGLADVLFTGLLLGLVRRGGLSMVRAVVGLVMGGVVFLMVHLSSGLLLPVLVFSGPAVALALGRTVAPRRGEMGLALVFLPLVWGIGLLVQP